MLDQIVRENIAVPKLAANLSTLFLELPIEDRPIAVAKAGFCGVELRFLDAGPSDAFVASLKSSGLEMVMFNANPGDLGLAAVPGQLERFKTALLDDLTCAEKLGARRIHVMAGKPDQNLSAHEQFDAAVWAYSWAALKRNRPNLSARLQLSVSGTRSRPQRKRGCGWEATCHWAMNRMAEH